MEGRGQRDVSVNVSVCVSLLLMEGCPRCPHVMYCHWYGDKRCM